MHKRLDRRSAVNACSVVCDLDPAAVRDLLHCSVYDPELSVLENPEYFHANSELFAAHQLLLQRYGRAFFKN